MTKLTYTRKEVENLIQTAVEKTERSFGGTVKRLQGKNDALVEALEEARDFIVRVCGATLYSENDVADFDLADRVEQALAQAKE